MSLWENLLLSWVYKSSRKRMDLNRPGQMVGEILKKFGFSYKTVRVNEWVIDVKESLIPKRIYPNLAVESKDAPLILEDLLRQWTMQCHVDRKSTIEFQFSCVSSALDPKLDVGLWLECYANKESVDNEVICKKRSDRRYLSLVSPKRLVDEAVHKSLVEAQERAATTASSLEVEQDSGSGPSTSTTRTSANREVELTATIDGQVKTITESSLRRHLKLEDNGGVTTLPNSEIFEQLTLMGGYSGIAFALFPTMISAPETSPSRITSSPSLSAQHTPVSTPINLTTTKHSTHTDAKEAVPMPHESPFHSAHLLGRDEGSLSLNELTDLCTSLSNKGKSLIEELDMDAGIYLVPSHAVDEGRNDDTQIYDLPAEQLGVFSAATALADAAKRRRSVETVQTYTRRRRSVSTGSGRVSNASRTVNTAGVKAKDKGKAIMQESEPPKKVKKRVQVQMSMNEELAKKVFEEKQAKAMAEQEQERINFEASLELKK
ncbi:hypothetical protein Tco_0466655 [Tanacetum coccineum]